VRAAEIRLEQSPNFAGFGVAFELELGIEQFAIHAEFKAPAIGGDDLERFDFGGKFCQQFVRQTGGAAGVLSSGTVDEFELEHGGLGKTGVCAGQYITGKRIEVISNE